ncbi:MAG TPA: hypothetical protein VHI51_02375 [Ktedonobacterales bacterium]|nr:hypothetical protein [Ktedonobacterales bacterium]
MLDELKRAFEQAQKQSEEAQRDLAQRIQDWIAEQRDEREWDALVGSPAGQETLERLGAEAREDVAQGKTRDLSDIL